MIEPLVFEIKKEWFKEGYYVYIINLMHKSDEYFYTGVTGDYNYLIARAPFYRMTGHFNRLNSSTENQIISGIKDLTNKNQRIEDSLQEFKITYFWYKIFDFIPNPHPSIHRQKREEVELI